MGDEELLVFNGINGATGEYELPPMKPSDIAAVALHEQIGEELWNTLKSKHEQQEAHYGVNADVTDLSQTGWGVIFAAKDTQVDALRDALQPLLALRREQAGEYYKEFSGPDGYRPGDSHLDFLKRQQMGPGPADPTKVPYYLLLVGDPELLPYRFQFSLDVQYAVGRIHFDTLEQYAQYAESVVTAEKSGVKLPRKAVFFGTQSPNDRATTLSARQLVRPLSNELRKKLAHWELKTYIAEQAHKAQLAHLLGGDETPAFLFSASHGMGFPKGDPRQLRHQGALLCSDWPGPQWRKPIPEDFYFSADDLSGDAHLAGMLAFFFACYGAGTPKLDEFAREASHERVEIAPRAFVANLPRRMLSHPKGSALAAVGHVERAWGYSFMWGDAGRQLKVFEDTLEQLLNGYPIGAAMEWFNERYAELSVVLTNEIEDIEYGKKRDDVKLAGLWTADKDARSYIILGDPAVRLPVAQADEKPTARPVITLSDEQRKKLTNPSAPVTAFAEAAADSPPDAETFAVAYGLSDQFSNLQASLRSFTEKLSAALSKAANDIMTLEVKTYTTASLDKITLQDDGAARLRALTYISFDGDMKVYVPEKADGGVDQELWQIHLDVVREAQANRAKFIASMADMATSLLKSLK